MLGLGLVPIAGVGREIGRVVGKGRWCIGVRVANIAGRLLVVGGCIVLVLAA